MSQRRLRSHRPNSKTTRIETEVSPSRTDWGGTHRPNSKTTRIETELVLVLPFLPAHSQTEFQNNKDWNRQKYFGVSNTDNLTDRIPKQQGLKPSIFSGNTCSVCSQTEFQNNKDWNYTRTIDETCWSAHRPNSKTTRIETIILAFPQKKYKSSQTEFQNNKDWNSHPDVKPFPNIWSHRPNSKTTRIETSIQTSPVHCEYPHRPNSKTTRIETNVLYIYGIS